MKLCSRCRLPQSDEFFNRKGDKLSTYCKKCNKEYLREHYKKNRKYYKNKSRTTSKKLYAELNEFKTSNPCSDCGKFFHFSVMDFDHIRGKKIANIAMLANLGSSERLHKELEKCELVCSNCHRYRTWKRLNSPVV